MSKRAQTELMIVSEQGNLDRIKTLANPKSLSEKNSAGYTPLALAVKEGHFEAARELINQGTDINAINDAGQSILFLACWHNRENIVKLLLEKKVKIDLPDHRGWTPLTISVYHNYTNIVQLLLNAGCDIEHKDCFGKKAIDRAKNIEMITLLQKTASLRRKKERSQSPMTRNSTESSAPQVSWKSKEEAINVPKPAYTNLARRNSSSLISVKSESSLKSVSRYSTPTMSKADISIRSDSVRPDNRRKIKEGMEAYMKSSSHKFEAQLDEEWFQKLGEILNDQLRNTQFDLEKEAENLLARASKELFIKLKENTVDNVERLSRANERRINESYSSEHKIENFPEKKINRSSSAGKLIRENYQKEDSAYDVKRRVRENYQQEDLAFDVKRQVMRYAEQQYIEIQGKMKKVSNSMITKEINNRILANKHYVTSQLQDNLTDIEMRLKNYIENTVNDKISQISGQSVPNSKESTQKSSAKYEEYRFIDQVIKDPPIPIEKPQRKVVEFAEDSDEHQENGFDYIESISKSYEQYRSPSNKCSYPSHGIFSSPSKDNSASKLPPNPKKSKKSEPKQPVPPTSVTSALQGFIKSREAFKL
ncbi:unnamed protein product [Blepharisma stoltei]|uniref:Uncharacterized protein n=1 Tax=Blepharisma stoltei TaxID=1481888 RepID=A0AAU9IEB4_9CILI|nr:unnamed protein product [Blepharisma stoltei]